MVETSWLERVSAIHSFTLYSNDEKGAGIFIRKNKNSSMSNSKERDLKEYHSRSLQCFLFINIHVFFDLWMCGSIPFSYLSALSTTAPTLPTAVITPKVLDNSYKLVNILFNNRLLCISPIDV